jgi:hypothetical protein
MSPGAVSVKNPVFVESGRRGMRARWGPPRLCRLDSLTGPQRDLIIALVQTMKAPTSDGHIPEAGMTTGGTRDAASST